MIVICENHVERLAFRAFRDSVMPHAISPYEFSTAKSAQEPGMRKSINSFRSREASHFRKYRGLYFPLAFSAAHVRDYKFRDNAK